MLQESKFNKSIIKDKNSNKRASIQLITMIGLTIIIQVVTILKTSVVAAQFGATIEMDAFNFSNSIGVFIFSFIGAGVTTVLIPNLVNKDDDQGVNIFISTLYTIGFIVLLIVYFMRKFIVQGLSNGSDEFIYISCNIMFITLLTQYVTSFLGATDAIFQCKGKFNFPKIVNLVITIILVSIIIFSSNITIYKYAFYILIASITSVIIQIILAIKYGYKFKFKIDIRNKKFRNMFHIFLPTVLSTGLYQFSLLTDTVISSNLGEGSVSILGYSNSLMSMVNTILLTNLMTYFYPKIAKNINKENSQNNIFDLMILISGIMCLITIVFLCVGKYGIQLLYERGNFTAIITNLVYVGTALYMLGIPINSMRDLMYRYFYAKGDTITPFKNSLIVSILNILISIILSGYMQVNGIILGTVITSYISFIMIFFRFSKKFTIKYSKKILILENLKIFIASFVVIVFIKSLIKLIPVMNALSNIIIYGVITVIVYILILILFKSKIFKIKL